MAGDEADQVREDTDSDADLDFGDVSQEDTLQTLRQQVEALQSQIQEKRGENAILLARLNNTSQRHTRQLNEATETQSRALQSQISELESLRAEVEGLRTERLFAANELKARTQRSARTPVPSKRAEISNGVGDGFVVKKPRTHDSHTSAGNTVSRLSSSGLAATILINHQLPGIPPSLQILSEVKHPRLDTSLAAFILQEQTKPVEEFVTALLGIFHANIQEQMPLVGLPVVLAVIYSVFMRLPPQMPRPTTALDSEGLQALVINILEHLEPLPNPSTLPNSTVLDETQCYSITTVLYALDVLSILDWPVNYSARFINVTTNSKIPQVIQKAFDIIQNSQTGQDQPRVLVDLKATDALILFDAQLKRPPVPPLEILFGGLIDSGRIHAYELPKYSPTLLAFSWDEKTVQLYAELNADKIYCQARRSVVAAAVRMEPSAVIWFKISNILAYESAKQRTQERDLLIASCIDYLWRYSHFMRTSSSKQILVPTITRMIYSDDKLDPATLWRARDILGQLVNPEEEEEIAELLGVPISLEATPD